MKSISYTRSRWSKLFIFPFKIWIFSAKSCQENSIYQWSSIENVFEYDVRLEVSWQMVFIDRRSRKLCLSCLNKKREEWKSSDSEWFWLKNYWSYQLAGEKYETNRNYKFRKFSIVFFFRVASRNFSNLIVSFVGGCKNRFLHLFWYFIKNENIKKFHKNIIEI